MYLTKHDLKTELYPEVVAEITRANDEEVEQHINAAIDFTKGFLFKYDLTALFGKGETEPTVTDESLKKAVKIIAAYFLVRKANPNVSLKLFREDYMLMIGTKDEPGWLYEVRNGEINPDWPRKPDDPETLETDESQENQDVFWTSNKQRVNRF